MPTTVKRSKSKPDVEFQYGRRLFSEKGSSNISAMVEFWHANSFAPS